MKPPLFCLAAALLFWGWISGFMVPALLMAASLEFAGLSGVRVRIRHRDLNRVADLCVLFISGAIVYLFFTPMDNESFLPLVVTQWSPMLFFPLALAQAYAETEQFALFAVLPVLGARKSKLYDQKPWKTVRANLLFPYFGLVLLAAGSANQRYDWYYAALFALVAWGLTAARNRRAVLSGASGPSSWFGLGRLLWPALILACGAIGYLGQEHLDALQSRLRGWASGSDPYHRETSMGSMGELKLSDSIVMRIRPAPGQARPPRLLREASYNFFRGRSWEAGTGIFAVVPATDADKTDWELHPGLGADTYVTIYRFFPRRMGLVPAPAGATRLSSLPARELVQNTLGAIKAEWADGLCAYNAWYLKDTVLEAPPNVMDSVVLPNVRDAMESIVRDSGLDAAAPEDVPGMILRYFWKHFRYSLVLEQSDRTLSPLSDFLLNTRKGHCEYFATAAAMLLRQVGIPSRYVVGYALMEQDPETDVYLVRERHRHAWVIYYLQDAWHTLDATPPDWGAKEYRKPDFWQKLADYRSRAIFAMASWRWLEEGSRVKQGLLLAALGLGALLAVRILRQQGKQGFWRVRRLKRKQGRKSNGPAFARVEDRLRTRGLIRPDWQPLEQWLRSNKLEALLPALRLHYKQRFDPAGLSEEEQHSLQRLVEEWLR